VRENTTIFSTWQFPCIFVLQVMLMSHVFRKLGLLVARVSSLKGAFFGLLYFCRVERLLSINKLVFELCFGCFYAKYFFFAPRLRSMTKNTCIVEQSAGNILQDIFYATIFVTKQWLDCCEIVFAMRVFNFSVSRTQYI